MSLSLSLSREETLQRFKRIGIVGAGNMGSMMALAFAELGLDVSVWDVDGKNISRVSKTAGYLGRVAGYDDMREFVASLKGQGGERKVFLFSMTHGSPADSVLGMLMKMESGDGLRYGDVILDAGSEDYRRTERRQIECARIGVYWVGMGVSGGYRAARRGPSLSPGGDERALEILMPLLELYAAKDAATGLPCVARIGPGGSGHFVKMVHNGIEGGMLSTLAEAWSLLHYGRGFDYERIADAFDEWNKDGELRNNYLLEIGADMLRTKKSREGDSRGDTAMGGYHEYVLDDVLDEVIQDYDNTEGTPYWSITESASRHISAPTLAAAHYLRIANGNQEERLEAAKKLRIPSPSLMREMPDEKEFVEHLRRAVYASFLASFCQGLELIAHGSEDEGWNIDLGKCLQIWRAGCIIRSEGIADLLQPVLSKNRTLKNMKFIDTVAVELERNFHSLKKVIMAGIDSDHYLPAMSSTLEYLKYEGGTTLPTKFMEAQMNFFGAHGYKKREDGGDDASLSGEASSRAV